MPDKNEGIYLWLLEQDRQKNRAYALKVTDESPTLHFQSTQDNSRTNTEKSSEDLNEQSPLSENIGLDELIEEKADLEEESRRLDEEQRHQSLRIKILCEKLVQEIKKKNSQKRQTIDQMHTRIDKLETRLKEISNFESREENDTLEAFQEKLSDHGRGEVPVNIVEEIK